MHFRLIFVFILLFGLQQVGHAQTTTNDDKEPRILILLDGSSSMLQQWTDNEGRFSVASRIITGLMDSIYSVNDQVEFALRVYGHQSHAKDKNCFDTKKEVMFSKNNLTQMSLRLASLHPLGVSPIALSLQEAAENDLVNPNKYKYSLILITDGGESCGGDICTVVQQLLQKKIDFKPYILSLVDYSPLKQQYDCMGDYLLVTKENDIPDAIGKIVDAYRKAYFIEPIPTTQQILQKTTIAPPSALKVNIPKVTVTNDGNVAPPVKKTPPPPPVVETVPEPVDTTPVVVETPPPAPVVQEPIKKSNIVVNDTPPAPPVDTPKIVDTVVVVKTDTVEEVSIPVAQVKPPEPKKPIEPVYKKVDPEPVAQTTPPKNTTPQPPKKVDFKIERTEAKETTVKIFFTNGKGKFYETAPEVVLSDPRTGKEVSRFQRTVDVTGNPRPQTIPAGTYRMTIPGKDNFVIDNLEVRPDQENKFLITVNQASLRFEYDDPKNKAVVEYAAKVRKTFSRTTPTVTQLCTQELQYEPDNYHIDLNTLPKKQFNVDLEFDAVVVIKIQRPGYLQFQNTNDLGGVELFYQLGDKFMPFYRMPVNGNVAQQKLRLMPGPYKAIFFENAGKPNARKKVKDFFIRSDTITEIYLQ